MPINFNLNDYLNPVFVETGSAGGNGIEQALKAGFEKIYSIELSEQFHQQCEQHFEREMESGQVTLIFGDSTYALPKVLAAVEGQTTFWLDAHGGYGKTAMGEKMCPLMEELDAISEHTIKTHTILVDDRRLFSSSDSCRWGSLVSEQVIQEKILEINSRYVFETLNGVVKDDVLLARVP